MTPTLYRAALQKTKNSIEIKCWHCSGDGFTADHDPADPHHDGECSGGCPIQVQCDFCQATGIIFLEPISPEADVSDSVIEEMAHICFKENSQGDLCESDWFMFGAKQMRDMIFGKK